MTRAELAGGTGRVGGRAGGPATGAETRAETFEAPRSLLFAVACRVLGSLSEAENAGQKAWLRPSRALLAALVPSFLRLGGVLEPREVNGQPGAIFRDREGRVVNTWALDVRGGRVQAIRAVINPDKLGHLRPVADAWAVLGEMGRARRPADGPDGLALTQAPTDGPGSSGGVGR